MQFKDYYLWNNYILEVIANDNELLTISFVKTKEINNPNKITNNVLLLLKVFFEKNKLSNDIFKYLPNIKSQEKIIYSQLIKNNKVTSYKSLGSELNLHHRAIAKILSSNKIAILLPCHLVIGSNNKLTGYKWGIEVKKDILNNYISN